MISFVHLTAKNVKKYFFTAYSNNIARLLKNIDLILVNLSKNSFKQIKYYKINKEK